MKIEYPIEWSKRDQDERPAKGWLGDVIVELDNGTRHRLFFYNPIRLKQDLEKEMENGKTAIIEQGLIVITEVTKENIEKAINQAIVDGYFNKP